VTIQGSTFATNEDPFEMLFRACIKETGLSELAADIEAKWQAPL
jgi:hypothetical protein